MLACQRSARWLLSRKLASTLEGRPPNMPDLPLANRALTLQACAALCTPLLQFATIHSHHSRYLLGCRSRGVYWISVVPSQAKRSTGADEHKQCQFHTEGVGEGPEWLQENSIGVQFF